MYYPMTDSFRTALDTYQEHLDTHPDVVPSIGFHVLQQAVTLESVLHPPIIPAEPGDAVITLYRQVPTVDNPEGHYRVSIYSRTDTQGFLPRLSMSTIVPTKNHLFIDIGIFDTQGRRAEAGNLPLTWLHLDLARTVLASEAAHDHIDAVARRRKHHEDLLAGGQLCSRERRQITETLQSMKLK